MGVTSSSVAIHKDSLALLLESEHTLTAIWRPEKVKTDPDYVQLYVQQESSDVSLVKLCAEQKIQLEEQHTKINLLFKMLIEKELNPKYHQSQDINKSL